MILQRDRAILAGLLGQQFVDMRGIAPTLLDACERFGSVKRGVHHFTPFIQCST